MSDRQAARRAKSREHRCLGDAVRELRERNGISQAELAKGAGIQRRHLVALERGEVDPTFVTLVRLVRAIPAPLAELMRLFEQHRDAGD
jgi:transcriptional regulator with XRE-family HTH domain